MFSSSLWCLLESWLSLSPLQLSQVGLIPCFSGMLSDHSLCLPRTILPHCLLPGPSRSLQVHGDSGPGSLALLSIPLAIPLEISGSTEMLLPAFWPLTPTPLMIPSSTQPQPLISMAMTLGCDYQRLSPPVSVSFKPLALPQPPPAFPARFL